MFDQTTLTAIWAGLLTFAVFAYVVLDGFDLGIGILFPSLAVGEERDQAMNAIAPVWDGNETWLILGGGGLLAVFPLAYAVILSATYPLIITMLLGLVFRGVAFEFRWRDARHRELWDRAFCAGSLIATVAQGMLLGALLQGIPVAHRAYAGGAWDWLTPFSMLTGLSLLAGYALLGATRLLAKTSGSGQAHARRLSRTLGGATVLALALVSAATPALSIDYWHRWLSFPNILLTAQVPLLVLITTAVLFWSLRAGHERLPFMAALALFGLGFVGLGISIFPYVVPRSITIWDAAAPQSSLAFMLVGAVFILPMILAYTAWSYWIFRGKVAAHGYH